MHSLVIFLMATISYLRLWPSNGVGIAYILRRYSVILGKRRNIYVLSTEAVWNTAWVTTCKQEIGPQVKGMD